MDNRVITMALKKDGEYKEHFAYHDGQVYVNASSAWGVYSELVALLASRDQVEIAFYDGSFWIPTDWVLQVGIVAPEMASMFKGLVEDVEKNGKRVLDQDTLKN